MAAWNGRLRGLEALPARARPSGYRAQPHLRRLDANHIPDLLKAWPPRLAFVLQGIPRTAHDRHRSGRGRFPRNRTKLSVVGLYNASPFEATDQIAKRWGMKIPGSYPQRPREARFRYRHVYRYTLGVRWPDTVTGQSRLVLFRNPAWTIVEWGL